MIIPATTSQFTGSASYNHPDDVRPIVWQVPERLHAGNRENVTLIIDDLESHNANRKAQRLADERLSLLVRKYTGNSHGTEVQARLEILTRRLEEMTPQVTSDEVTALEQYAAELESIRTELSDIEISIKK